MLSHSWRIDTISASKNADVARDAVLLLEVVTGTAGKSGKAAESVARYTLDRETAGQVRDQLRRINAAIADAAKE
jgi:hypothetical protein